MGVYLMEVTDFLDDHLGQIMFLVGVMLLVVGVLWVNMFGSVLSAVSLFFGVLFVVFSIFVQLGVFSVRMRSLNGLGVIFICASIACFVFSIVVLQFLTVTIGVDIQYRRRVPFYYLVFDSERPYLWVSGIFTQLGLALFIVGILLKVYYALKS